VNSSKIVLFDIDGTLMRGAGPHHKDALIAATKQVLRVECTLDGIDTSGRMDTDLLRLMLNNAGVKKPRISSNFRDVMEAAQHHYNVTCKADFTPHLCPGVRETLEMLTSHNIPIGLVTGNLSAIAWRKLENARIQHHFTFGAFAEEAPTRIRLAKLAAAKARRKHFADERCDVTLIGDHANDIEAARANEFRSVAVATGVMSADELRALNPDVVLQNLEGATMDFIFGTQ
jgi:phosphoglycolate phosphatase-like HAD superfamily hydrolase